MGNGPEFFQTMMGSRFFEHTMPRLVTQVGRLADQLEQLQPHLLKLANPLVQEGGLTHASAGCACGGTMPWPGGPHGMMLDADPTDEQHYWRFLVRQREAVEKLQVVAERGLVAAQRELVEARAKIARLEAADAQRINEEEHARR